MFNLTKQERLVLFCLALIILCGSTIHYLFKKYPSIKKVLSLIEDEALYKKIDVNQASAQQFEALPFIGQVTAERIVAYRVQDRKSTRLNSSHSSIPYSLFC